MTTTARATTQDPALCLPPLEARSKPQAKAQPEAAPRPDGASQLKKNVFTGQGELEAEAQAVREAVEGSGAELAQAANYWVDAGQGAVSRFIDSVQGFFERLGDKSWLASLITTPLSMALELTQGVFNSLVDGFQGALGGSGQQPLIHPKYDYKSAAQLEPKPSLWGDSGTPTAWDVKQGELGDCWLMASMTAVAQRDPQQIKDAIKDNGDGTYTVRLYEKGAGGYEPVYVTVDDKLPVTEDGQLAYAQLGGDKALWPAIIEKAYAKHFGNSYGQLNAGLGEHGLGILTGEKQDSVPLSKSMDDASLVELLNRGPGVAVTTRSPENEELLGWHAYTVNGARRVGFSGWEVTVVNPHDGARTRMSLEAFREDYLFLAPAR